MPLRSHRQHHHRKSRINERDDLPTKTKFQICLVVFTLLGGAVLAVSLNILLPARIYGKSAEDQMLLPFSQQYTGGRPVPEKLVILAQGGVKVYKNNEDLCLDHWGNSEAGVYLCEPNHNDTQTFTLYSNGSFISDKKCLEVDNDEDSIRAKSCDDKEERQHWTYSLMKQTIYNYYKNICLSHRDAGHGNNIHGAPCSNTSDQKWKIDTVFSPDLESSNRSDAIRNFNSNPSMETDLVSKTDGSMSESDSKTGLNSDSKLDLVLGETEHTFI